MAEKATIVTSLGTIELELWPDKAPNHVENLKKLADDGFYDGLIFHRVIPGFMVQTGCPHGSGTGGPGWNVDAEFNDAEFTIGTLGMARSSDPNSAGSQFFVCTADTHLHGQSQKPEYRYTAFGRVTVGQDVANAIADVPRGPGDRPNEDVVMESLRVE